MRALLFFALVCCACSSSPDTPAAGAGAGAGTNAGSGGAGMPASPECTSCGACPQTLPVLSAVHQPGPIDYPDPPPVGGDHDACWARWGVHEEAVPARNWVHNLEHGGVVFLHHCPSGCPDELAGLKALSQANLRTLVTPYAELNVRFAVVAWGVRLQSDCFDQRAFQAFYDAHFNHGLESIASEPPASCQ